MKHSGCSKLCFIQPLLIRSLGSALHRVPTLVELFKISRLKNSHHGIRHKSRMKIAYKVLNLEAAESGLKLVGK